MEKIKKEQSELTSVSLKKLQKTFGNEDFERFEKLVREKIGWKIKSYVSANGVAAFGYSEVYYDDQTKEVFGYSATGSGSGLSPAYCDVEEGEQCPSSYIYATLTSDIDGQVDSEYADACGGGVDVYLYASEYQPSETYCVYGENDIIDNEMV